MINEVFINKISVMSTIKEAIKRNVNITATDKKVESIKDKIEEKEGLLNSLINMKMKNPNFDDMIFTNKYNELTFELKELNDEYNKLELDTIHNHKTTSRLRTISNFLDNNKDNLTILTIDILKSFIDKILVVERDEVLFCVSPTKRYNDTEFIEYRNSFIDLDPINEGHYYHEPLQKSMKYKVVFI